MDREEQHRNNVTLPRSCSSSAPGLGTGLSLLEGSAHLGPLNVLSNSDCSWLRASQPQENVELCLVLSKCSQGLGMVMPAAKAGVHRGLLVTITGYYLHFNGPTKGKKDPYFQLLHCSQKQHGLPKRGDLHLPRLSAKCWTCWTLFIPFAISRLRLAFRQCKFVIFFQRHHMKNVQRCLAPKQFSNSTTEGLGGFPSCPPSGLFHQGAVGKSPSPSTPLALSL